MLLKNLPQQMFKNKRAATLFRRRKPEVNISSCYFQEASVFSITSGGDEINIVFEKLTVGMTFSGNTNNFLAFAKNWCTLDCNFCTVQYQMYTNEIKVY